ncbi:MAG TPA: hypothetical protein DD635_02890 [Flavobacteriales bacterium]|nr:hypothetical protein [Flavobacteriales bacterium]
MNRISAVSTKVLSAASLRKLEDAGLDCLSHDFVLPTYRKDCNSVMHDTVLVSSQNALHGCNWEGRRVLCVGEATAEELRQRGAKVHSVHTNAASLTREALSLDVPCTFLCGSTRMPTIENGFTEAGGVLQVVEVYDIIPNGIRVNPEVEAVLFFSPTGVKSFHALNSCHPRAFCIGPTTAEAARTFGHEALFVTNPSREGVVDLVIATLRP